MHLVKNILFLSRKTCLQPFHFLFYHPGNYYGTPKPPAEPSPVQPDLVDQVLFDEEFDTEVQRKRTTSVSKMDRKDSAAPEEEEEEDRPPMVNGLAGERQHCLFLSLHWLFIRIVIIYICPILPLSKFKPQQSFWLLDLFILVVRYVIIRVRKQQGLFPSLSFFSPNRHSQD